MRNLDSDELNKVISIPKTQIKWNKQDKYFLHDIFWQIFSNIEFYVDQYDQLVHGTILSEKQKLGIFKAKISIKTSDLLLK